MRKFIIGLTAILLSLSFFVPATAVAAPTTGPLGGTCAVGAGTGIGGTAMGIDTQTISVSNGTGTITYTVETGCLIIGAMSGSNALVNYYINASCTSGVCPATATIGNSVHLAANSNNQAPGASAAIDNETASGYTINIAPAGGNEAPVLIFTGGANFTSYPTHGHHSNTVALFGGVTVSAAMYPNATPSFTVQWQKGWHL